MTTTVPPMVLAYIYSEWNNDYFSSNDIVYHGSKYYKCSPVNSYDCTLYAPNDTSSSVTIQAASKATWVEETMTGKRVYTYTPLSSKYSFTREGSSQVSVNRLYTKIVTVNFKALYDTATQLIADARYAKFEFKFGEQTSYNGSVFICIAATPTDCKKTSPAKQGQTAWKL